MKILLVAINAKYVQTNLAIRLLKAFAEAHSVSVRSGLVQIETSEWNTNQLSLSIVRGIYEKHPDLVLFSTYIWNREMVLKVAGDVKKVLPDSILGFGGPEVSWSAESLFSTFSEIDLILSGEGELTFVELIERLVQSGKTDFSGIRGLYSRNNLPAEGSSFTFGGFRQPIENLDIIPFPYSHDKMDFDPSHRLVYYESSRGCPFSCAYCLSSLDKSVRYYPLERVLKEIGYFMDEGFPLVKFVDRTFNLDPERYIAIWSYIRDHHNGKTLFHFEIAAEYLSDGAFTVLETMKEGSVQFEIGIQSINPETLKIVGRPAHPDKLAEKIRRIPRIIHTHIDLIAGLPAEDMNSFISSFNYAFALNADMLQLGFLKVLAGTPMEVIAKKNRNYVWSTEPPYEIFSTPVLSYAELLVLKDVEQVVDTWFNSGLMRRTLNQLVSADPTITAFSLFLEISNFIRSYFTDGDLYLPRRPADSFSCMAAFINHIHDEFPENAQKSIEFLKYDFLLQGKPGSFPLWFERRYLKKEHDDALEQKGFFSSVGASRRTVYSRTEYEVFYFDSQDSAEKILFVYQDSEGKKQVKTIRL